MMSKAMPISETPCIHPTAVIGQKARLHPAVEVGPYTVIEDHVQVGARTRIGPHVHLLGYTTLGEDNEIHAGAVLGDTPQDLKFEGGESYLRIGNKNVFREYCTVHRGGKPGSTTVIGDRNYLMGFTHVGHDGHLGDDNVLCNGAMLGGHVTLIGQVVLSTNVQIHQFTRVGRLAMASTSSLIGMDVPPFVIVAGRNQVRAVNLVGLRRAGVSKEGIREIQNAYKFLYRSGLNMTQALERMEQEGLRTAEIRELIDFCRSTKRGIMDHHGEAQDS